MPSDPLAWIADVRHFLVYHGGYDAGWVDAAPRRTVLGAVERLQRQLEIELEAIERAKTGR